MIHVGFGFTSDCVQFGFWSLHPLHKDRLSLHFGLFFGIPRWRIDFWNLICMKTGKLSKKHGVILDLSVSFLLSANLVLRYLHISMKVESLSFLHFN